MEAAPAVPTRWWILFVILAVEVMDLLDGTVVNVATPAIKADFHATNAALQWITGGYALAFAVGLVTGGRLGDIFGRRRLFLIGVAGFTLSSAACGLAATADALIGFRVVQGLFAALMIPQGFGIVRQVFPKEELGKAFGLFGPVIGGSAILGPIVGGFLVDGNLFGMGWRMIFLVNLPLGLGALIAGLKLLPESKASNAPSLDVVGALLVSAAAALVIYPLIQGPELDWPAWTFAMMAGSAVSLIAFVLVERRREAAGQSALVPLRLFAARVFPAGLAAVLVFFGAVVGLLFMLSLYLQLGSGFSAVKTGVSIIPWAFGVAVGAGVSAGVLSPRFGRPVLHGALAVLAAGIGGLLWVVHTQTGQVSVPMLAVPMLLCGLGMGSIISPLFNYILAGVQGDDVGSASGVLNAVQQLGGAAGIAVLGTVFFTAVKAKGFGPALERALVVELGFLAVCALLIPLLPMRALEQEAH